MKKMLKNIRHKNIIEIIERDGFISTEGIAEMYGVSIATARRDLDELEAGSYIVRYKTVATSRFDSTSFKKTYEDLYKAFLKQTTSRRFSISY